MNRQLLFTFCAASVVATSVAESQQMDRTKPRR